MNAALSLPVYLILNAINLGCTRKLHCDGRLSEISPLAVSCLSAHGPFGLVLYTLAIAFIFVLPGRSTHAGHCAPRIALRPASLRRRSATAVIELNFRSPGWKSFGRGAFSHKDNVAGGRKGSAHSEVYRTGQQSLDDTR